MFRECQPQLKILRATRTSNLTAGGVMQQRQALSAKSNATVTDDGYTPRAYTDYRII
jgi:hypothetical protein